VRLEVRADLDLPGETTRQWRVFLIWFVCLAITVGMAVSTRPTAQPSAQDHARDLAEHEARLQPWRRQRLLLVVVLGVGFPSLLTWWMTRRRRRGGPHPRGIVIDLTEDGELRLWGRGYGRRVLLEGSEISERLVDVYTGRLGAWRQRRIRVRPSRPLADNIGAFELATPAIDDDLDLGLRLEGGEGDCIELKREDYLQLVEAIRARSE
jgi:hypothetical protein